MKYENLIGIIVRMRGKENFYVFLDIDGVLWDWQWRISQMKLGNVKNAYSINIFNPESIEALNTLMDYLDKNYNCELVLSSSWRRAFGFAIKNLNANGVHLPDSVSRTSIDNLTLNRGKRIEMYLKGKDEKGNFLILDDQKRDFKKYFTEGSIIRTNIYTQSLTMAQIQNWIAQRENTPEIV